MNEFHIPEHHSPIKTPTQLVVVAVLSFIVPVLLIVGIVQLIIRGMKVDPKDPAFSEQAIAQRLKPVGEVTSGDAPPAPAAPTVVATATAKSEPVSGDKVYQTTCAICHAAGIAGAPKVGDKAAWKSRLGQGADTLHKNAIMGIRMMPAKGGNAGLADADVKAAVDYMIAQSK